MRQKHFVLIVFLVTISTLRAQEIPLEGSTLHYSDIYFEEDFVTNAVTYELAVYPGTVTTRGKELVRLKGKLPAFWNSSLEWNASYTWRISAFNAKGDTISTGKPHTFRITKLYNGTNSYEHRVRVLTNKEKKHGMGLICIDNCRTIYDRKGRPVWVLPDLGELIKPNSQVRDIKWTHDNTFTLLGENFLPIEVDDEMKIKWHAPVLYIFERDTVTFHHDFKKTKRGTYMVLGNRKVFRKISPDNKERGLRAGPEVKKVGDDFYRRTEMGMVMEFSHRGELLWYWDANPYITEEDLNYKKTEGIFRSFNTHMNAFSENSEGTKVYVGFRDISRVIKVDKLTKKVELSYGEKFPSGEASLGNDLFRNQHDAEVTDHNSILILNNNAAGGGGVSSVMELRDNPKPGEDVLLWKFDLNFDNLTVGKSQRGGNVDELPNSNLLVCAGILNRVFEVNKKKEIVWDAFIEYRPHADSSWKPSAQYRASWLKQINRFYFLCRVKGDISVADQALDLKLEIYNTGNAPDTYLIQVTGDEQQVLYKSISPEIGKGGSFKRPLNVKVPAKGAVYLKVHSRQGEGREKTITVRVN